MNINYREAYIISAPAGFGKTTLLSNWIKQKEIPTAWVSIDKNDNDPVELLSYIRQTGKFVFINNFHARLDIQGFSDK